MEKNYFKNYHRLLGLQRRLTLGSKILNKPSNKTVTRSENKWLRVLFYVQSKICLKHEKIHTNFIDTEFICDFLKSLIFSGKGFKIKQLL